MEYVGIFYGHLVHFTAKWYVVATKIWQPLELECSDAHFETINKTTT
jgi:hypothetical protein